MRFCWLRLSLQIVLSPFVFEGLAPSSMWASLTKMVSGQGLVYEFRLVSLSFSERGIVVGDVFVSVPQSLMECSQGSPHPV